MTEFEVFFLKSYVGVLSGKVHDLKDHAVGGLNESSSILLDEVESMVDDLFDICKVAAGGDPCGD